MRTLQRTIEDADNAIRELFAQTGFKGKLQYDPAQVIETDRWWYIPMVWIGCPGFIVNKENLYVNWLAGGGSANLETTFWGHDRNLYNDLVDFTFAPDTDLMIVKPIVAAFRHMHPNSRGVLPQYPVMYRDSEIDDAIQKQFPTFKRHNVYCAVHLIREAAEKKQLKFSCELSEA